jgi:hypothetical protein
MCLLHQGSQADTFIDLKGFDFGEQFSKATQKVCAYGLPYSSHLFVVPVGKKTHLKLPSELTAELTITTPEL